MPPISKTMWLIAAVFICLLPSLEAQKLRYDNASKRLVLDGVPPPKAPPRFEGKARWEYFWEFGDGHYGVTTAVPYISYIYDEKGKYDAQVSLIPFYSYEPSRVYQDEIDVKTAGGQKPDSQGADDKLSAWEYIDMVTHPEKEMTPNSKIQVAVHYQVPANLTSTEGYLFLFYNNVSDKDKLGIEYFLFNPAEYRSAQEHQRLRSLSEVGGIGNSPKAKLQELCRLSDWRGLALSGLKPGTEYRTFFSLPATNALDSNLIKRKKLRDLTISLQAMFIPKGVDVAPRQLIAETALLLDYVRDPNRIKVIRPRTAAYFNPKYPQEIVYHVDFQNKGSGAARQVDVEIPWSPNLDPQEISLISWSPSKEEGCDRCKGDFAPPNDTVSCVRIDTSRLATDGVVVFSFHNILLQGKKEEGVSKKKYTKGELRFRVKGNRKKQGRHKMYATLHFVGQTSRDEEKTGKVTKSWRHAAWGLKIGQLQNAAPQGFRYSGEGLDRLTLGAYFRNTALKTGLGWGWAIDYDYLAFEGYSAIPTDFIFIEGSTGFPTALLLQEEAVQMHTLSIQGQLNARLGGWLTIGAGGGLLLPVAASGTLQAEKLDAGQISNSGLNIDIDNFPIELDESQRQVLFGLNGLAEDTEQTNFGLLNQGSGDQFLFQEDVASRRTVGGVVHWYAEAGPLDGLALGFRQSFIRLPNSYKSSCIKLNTAQFYLRFKLNTRKP